MNILYGTLMGVLLALPIGPMGFLGALLRAQNNKNSAHALAIGVCLADGVLAFFAVKTADSLADILQQNADIVLGLRVFLIFAFFSAGLYLWRNAEETSTPKKTQSFLTGFTSTLLHVGNVIAFASVFIYLQTQGITFISPREQILTAACVALGAYFTWLGLFWLTKRKGVQGFINLYFTRFKKGVAIIFALTGLYLIFNNPIA